MKIINFIRTLAKYNIKIINFDLGRQIIYRKIFHSLGAFLFMQTLGLTHHCVHINKHSSIITINNCGRIALNVG